MKIDERPDRMKAWSIDLISGQNVVHCCKIDNAEDFVQYLRENNWLREYLTSDNDGSNFMKWEGKFRTDYVTHFDLIGSTIVKGETSERD